MFYLDLLAEASRKKLFVIDKNQYDSLLNEYKRDQIPEKYGGTTKDFEIFW